MNYDLTQDHNVIIYFAIPLSFILDFVFIVFGVLYTVMNAFRPSDFYTAGIKCTLSLLLEAHLLLLKFRACSL